jgi:hypothetical protein
MRMQDQLLTNGYMFYLSIYALPIVSGVKYHNPNPKHTVSDNAGSLVDP